MKVAYALTLAAILAIFGSLAMHPRPQDPQTVIFEMVNSARAGDVKSYLAAFTGTLSDQLKQSGADATYLRDSVAGIKGVAVADPQELSDGELSVRAEFILQDRNQVQTMILEPGPRGWKIARTDSAQQLLALIPYGTPIK